MGLASLCFFGLVISRRLLHLRVGTRLCLLEHPLPQVVSVVDAEMICAEEYFNRIYVSRWINDNWRLKLRRRRGWWNERFVCCLTVSDMHTGTYSYCGYCTYSTLGYAYVSTDIRKKRKKREIWMRRERGEGIRQENDISKNPFPFSYARLMSCVLSQTREFPSRRILSLASPQHTYRFKEHTFGIINDGEWTEGLQ